MFEIRGMPPPTWAVEKVVAKLAEWNASILAFAIYLAKDIGAKYRPGGSEAVHTWEFFVSCADSFGQMPEPEKPGHMNAGLVTNNDCHHEKPKATCQICLQAAVTKAKLDAMSEAF